MTRALLAILLVALLAGCIATPQRPSLRAAPVTLEAGGSEQYPGLTVRGTLSGDADGLHVHAVARNDGERTYQVETGCSSPWSEQLFRGNDSVPMRKPALRCEGFSLRSFAPGDELTFDVDWDGLVWSEDAKVMAPARSGDYTWSVRFVAYPPDAFAAKRFDLDFNVTVLG